ncbi:fungal specific transcription factor [Colletotrichum tofieldiae]|uniref:Fungal specific transcription factor n=1 Tax=Colletotrichum tofieldiae TaxID=708197 RepID=A0A166PAT9_9PEZI|nr:fungal specific transcription factor [Colletotrichum tofieldiae]
MAPEIGSLRALANGESQFIGSSSGVYFINTVKQAFATPNDVVADNCQHVSGALRGTELQDCPSPEDCIVGGGEDTDPKAPGTSPGHEENRGPYTQSSDHVSSFSTSRDFLDGMDSLPDYSVARDLVLTYFRIWHPLAPFLQGPECLAELDTLYHSGSNSEREIPSSTGLLVTFRCIFNIARLEKDNSLDMGSTTIRSPSDLLPTLSLLALRCDTVSIQALLCAQVYFISTMSLRHASTVSGLLLKSIFQSGMHRCPVRYEHLSPDERSMRKRIFWSFYVLDRFVSQSLGHPNGIQDSDIDVCPPGHRDLHEPVVESNLSPGSVANTILHLPSNHPDRLAASPVPMGQTQGRESAQEAEQEELNNATEMHHGDVSSRSAAIRRHRQETQAVLENHVHHSRLVGRILEVFHKSIHARNLDSQTVLLLKADVSAFGNNLTQLRLRPANPDVPSLTPDPTVFPFISYHYTILLLNRPSLSLVPRCAEFREALQTCIGAANAIIQTIHQYTVYGGPLFWPGWMPAVWMSGLVLALAARLKLYNKTRAKSATSVALDLLATMTERWAMARHCKEVLSLLLQSIEAGPKGHKRSRSDANLVEGTPTTEYGSNLFYGTDQHHVTQSPMKRQNMTGHRSGSQNSCYGNHVPISPRADSSVFTQTMQGPPMAAVQRSKNSINPRSRESRQNTFHNDDLRLHVVKSPQGSWVDCPQLNQSRHQEACQFTTPPNSNVYSNLTSIDPYFAPIPITFPDRQRNIFSQDTYQLDGNENFLDMFDGATWGSMLDIVNSAGKDTDQ